jgi:hypothetical protein
MLRLLEGADVLLDASCGAFNEALGLDRATLGARFPSLVTARMTPFGDDGPWQDLKSSDLIHLALGGIMMNCGYDPDPNLEYDTPPIAPQIWHAYHIAGEQLATGVIAALIHRHRSGQGQDVSVAVHEAVSKNPELDIMHWVMRRVPIWRMTNRHAAETPNHSPSISHTKDGRWFITHGMGARDLKNLVPLLSKYGLQADLQPPPPDADLKARQSELGSDFIVIGTDGVYTSGFITNGRTDKTDPDSGTVAEGVYGTNADTNPPTSEFADFKNLYNAYFPLAPGASPDAYTANTYDAAILAVLAILQAGTATDGVKIRDALYQVSKGGTAFGPAQLSDAIQAILLGQDIDYKGASGNVDLDDTGNTISDYIVWKVVNGKYVDPPVDRIKASELLK